MKTGDKSAAGAVREKTPPRSISIVDDDASIREALKSLMRSVQFDAEAFASAEEFLNSERLNNTACLILDVYLPGMSGFELQNRLNIEQRGIPIVFITAHSDDASRQRALKAGAVEFLSKPVRREALFRAIQAAIDPVN
ncbi:MAG TPA: response regulator [Bryobacteraceae bacterium]|nr:response regulator [Bryobacteraceae bacterium]